MVGLIDVKDNVVYTQMGRDCQDFGMANITLKYVIGDILDVTDHASGQNPYFTPAKSSNPPPTDKCPRHER